MAGMIHRIQIIARQLRVLGNKDVREHGDYVPEHQISPHGFFTLPLTKVRHYEGGDG